MDGIQGQTGWELGYRAWRGVRYDCFCSVLLCFCPFSAFFFRGTMDKGGMVAETRRALVQGVAVLYLLRR